MASSKLRWAETIRPGESYVASAYQSELRCSAPAPGAPGIFALGAVRLRALQDQGRTNQTRSRTVCAHRYRSTSPGTGASVRAGGYPARITRVCIHRSAPARHSKAVFGELCFDLGEESRA